MNSKWNTKIARNFEARAPHYDRYCDVQSAVAGKLADELPGLERADILEIGCGTGALTQHLIDKYQDARFHITDISPQMLQQARTRVNSDADIRWSVMNGEQPEHDQHYDLIISNMAFQWFRDIDAALGRLRKLLKPGGVLLYTLPAPESFEEWTSTLTALSLPIGMLEFKTPPGVFKEEELIVQYESTFHFLQGLKKIGAHTPREGYQKLGYRDFLNACSVADERSQGRITWRVLYGRLEP